MIFHVFLSHHYTHIVPELVHGVERGGGGGVDRGYDDVLYLYEILTNGIKIYILQIKTLFK